MPMDVDSLSQLFQKLLNTPNREQQPYLLLIQHSLSFALRQTSTAEHESDEKLYRRAGLRTPAENARRDWEGGHLWLKHVASTLQKEAPSSLLWLRTSTRRVPEWLDRTAAHVIDVSSDPWGWESEESLNLNRLDAIVESLENAVAQNRQNQQKSEQSKPSCIPVIVESLTPLLMRHGLSRSIHFLKRIKQIPGVCPLVVPVLTESLTSKQHQVLEDLAQAVLWLDGGEAVLLRQGVREKGNLVRENLNYSIVTDSRGSSTMIELTSNKKDFSTEEQVVEVVEEVSVSSSVPISASKTLQRPRVQLQMEEEAPKPTTRSEIPAPQIYMQDDDPEFEDYDEEDPDDDLEI